MLRNKWDLWHLFGGVFLGILVFFMLKFPLFFMIVTFDISIILIFLSPILWEYWDTKKVIYNDKRVLNWSKFEKALFTSEGEFDKIDMALSYVGIMIGLFIISMLVRLLE